MIFWSFVKVLLEFLLEISDELLDSLRSNVPYFLPGLGVFGAWVQNHIDEEAYDWHIINSNLVTCQVLWSSCWETGLELFEELRGVLIQNFFEQSLSSLLGKNSFENEFTYKIFIKQNFGTLPFVVADKIIWLEIVFRGKVRSDSSWLDKLCSIV